MSHRHSPRWPDHRHAPPPGAVVEVIASHPLAPEYAWVGSVWDIRRGLFLAPQGGLSPVGVNLGTVDQWAWATLPADLRAAAVSLAFGGLILGAPTARSKYFGAIANNTDSAPYNSYCLDLNASGYWGLAYNDNGTTAQATDSTVAPVPGESIVISGHYAYGNQGVYRNGVQIASSGYASTANYAASASLTIGDAVAGASRNPNFWFDWGYIWPNRILTAAEHAEIAANPYAVLRLVVRRTYVFVGAGVPANEGPVVNAGVDQSIATSLPATVTLAGSATDDGLPAPPGSVTYVWSKVSGPGTVTFVDATDPATDASFSVAGTYVLRLTASDSVLTDTDDVTITVAPAQATWKQIAFVPDVVSLQASTPGTAQTGHVNISGTILAGGFSGPLTGNVTGNITGNASGSSGSCTGNAATATRLATARAINGVDFDGTGPITIAAAAGALTGTALPGTVVTSSLTAVGTITTGVWNAGAVTSSSSVSDSVGSMATIRAAAGIWTRAGTVLSPTTAGDTLDLGTGVSIKTPAESWIGPSNVTGIYFKGGNVGIGTTVPVSPLQVNGLFNTKNYTVATLPAATRGDIAYVTDALAPAFLTILVSGGAVVTPAFYNGTSWIGF